MDVLEPRSCRRRSVALSLVRPLEKDLGSDWVIRGWECRRCDSERRRRSSRSCFMREGASSGRDLVGVASSGVGFGLDIWDGGREDWVGC